MARDTPGRGARLRASLLCLVIGFAGTLGGAGCARRRAELTTYQAPIPKDGVVFVADGAGNYQCASDAFRQAAQEGRIPVQVVTFEWSHGYLRSLEDLTHRSHARREGRRLAELVEDYRRACPGKPVYLAGHSAGAMVVLAALEYLPVHSVDRAVLISPAVSCAYDLRPALQAIKFDLHNFHSDRDWIHCELFTRIFGNCDGSRAACAGRCGFLPQATGEDDKRLLSKLIQRPWTERDRETGNDGGHFGAYQSGFLRASVFPLFDAR